MKKERAPERQDDKPMAQKPCVVCGKLCNPYGYTREWGHLCSRKCNETWEKRKWTNFTNSGSGPESSPDQSS